MTGKRYYITTLADWRPHAARFANWHWLALDDAAKAPSTDASSGREELVAFPHAPRISGATRIFVLVEADEGTHLALEDDAGFEPLPHPLAQQPISAAAQASLARLGIATGATTFDAAEVAARVHPLLRHRVF